MNGPSDTAISFGSGHCCVCSTFCHHVGPVRLCAMHQAAQAAPPVVAPAVLPPVTRVLRHPDDGEMTQSAPYPHELAELVEHCTYRRGWQVYLQHHDRGQGSVGLTLFIVTDTVNSYDHDQRSHVAHLFIVPAAAYDRRSWQRWLFEQFHLVELHECMEFFEIDGNKPYAPSHGPGNDPYLIREFGTDVDRRTSFTGRLNP